MWSRKRSGIITRIKNGSCIVVDPDGVYEKIALPSPDLVVGSEVIYSRKIFPGVTKPLLLAASFLLLFGAVVFWQQAALKPAAAYITLDLNPSVEITVDKANLVKDVKYLDEEAKNFTDTAKMTGKDFDYALRSLIDEAIEMNYLKPGEENLIISTICPVGDKMSPVDQQMVRDIIEKSLSDHHYNGKIAVYSASQEMHTAAQELDVSMGKYVIYQQLIAAGEKVTINDMRNNKLGQIVSSYRMALPLGEKDKDAKNNESSSNNSNSASKTDDSIDNAKIRDRTGNVGVGQNSIDGDVLVENDVIKPNTNRREKGNWEHLSDFVANMVKDD